MCVPGFNSLIGYIMCSREHIMYNMYYRELYMVFIVEAVESVDLVSMYSLSCCSLVYCF